MILEVTIRSFYRCKEGDITPSITLVTHRPEGKLPEGKVDLGEMAKKIAAMVEDLPGEGLRPMTKAEVDEYVADEEAEAEAQS